MPVSDQKVQQRLIERAHTPLFHTAPALASRRRQLRKWHQVLTDKVVSLLDMDLVRHKDKWVTKIKEMREIFTRLESEGYDKNSQQVWRQHWDFQLYKALELQYTQVRRRPGFGVYCFLGARSHSCSLLLSLDFDPARSHS